MTQETLSSPLVTREFTGEYKSARSALAAAQRLRDENQDVDVRIVKFEKSPGYWMWRVTRVVEE